MCIDDAFRNTLLTSAQMMGIDLSDEMVHQMRCHFDLLVKRNETTNLTRITEPDEAAVKHYADSLALLSWTRSAAGQRAVHDGERLTVLDVGTGAGFPAIPLAVACRQWSITAIDGTRKKTDFLNSVAAELALGNLLVEHAHSDHWAPGRQFDVVAFRALAGMAKGLAGCARFVRCGGHVVAYKTAVLSNEECAATNSPPLGLRPVETYFYDLRWGAEVIRRALYVFAAPAREARRSRGRGPSRQDG